MEFSWVWFFVGLVVVAVGALILRFYQQISDTTGILDYRKWQMVGIIVIIVGFALMLNLHLYILNALINLMFNL